MAELKTAYGGQTPKSNDEIDDVDQLIENANRLIESVYRDINMAAISATPPPNNTNSRVRNQATSLTQRQLEIERIHRFCETVDEETRPLLRRRRSCSTRGRRSRSPNTTQTTDNIQTLLNSTFLRDESIGSTASDSAIEVNGLEHNEGQNANVAVHGCRSPRNSVNARRRSTTEPSNSRILNTGFLRDENGVDRSDSTASTNVPADDFIDLSNVPSVIIIPNTQVTNRENTTTTSLDVDDDDDVILVSCDQQDVVDLCTPVRENSRRSASTTTTTFNNNNRRPSNRQNRINQNNSPSRPNYRSRSPLETISEILGHRSVQTSTTNIQQLQQQHQLQQLQAKVVASSESAGVGDALSTASSANTLNSSNSSSERSILMCPVCMESAVKRKPTSTKCGHVFCQSCIQEALRLTHKCPMCNTKLSNRMLFRIYL